VSTLRLDSPRQLDAWTAQQIVDAVPDDTAPAYLLRDRDAITATRSASV